MFIPKRRSLQITAGSALLFVIGALLPPFAGTASAAVATVSFQQCANGTAAPHSCDWINGDVGHNNSVYSEGMSLPQRLLLTSITPTAGNHHSLVFDSAWTKAGKHAFDWITSYDQAAAAATFYGIPFTSLNECTGLGATCTAIRSGSNYIDIDVPDDAFSSSAGGSTQTRINQYESRFGNRTVRLWGSGLTGGGLTLSHPAGNDTGDTDITWTLTWTGASNVLLEFGAHIARSGGDTGWGSGTGAASINGSPYHVSLDSLDNSSLGSQDNQMKSDVLTPPTNIKVVKVLSPSSDPGLFDLQIDGQTKSGSSGVGDGGTTGFVPVSTGSHTVGEVAHTGTTLSNYTATTSCDNGTTSNSGTATFSVAEGDLVTCTITNTRQTGTLQVYKALSPNTDPGLFDLKIDGTTRVTDRTDGGHTAVTTVNTGTHTFAEAAGTGTSLADYNASAACLNGATPVTATLANGVWSVPVGDGPALVCTITNTRQTGTIPVVKHLSPTSDPGLFNLLIDGSVSATDQTHNGSTAVTTVNTGTHTVGETAGTGTSMSQYTSAVSCMNGAASVTATVTTGGWSVPVADGANVVCTITNTRQTGTLTVNKVFSPTGDPGLVNLSIDSTNYATNVGNGGTTGAQSVLTSGTHTVGETAGTGTSLSDYTTSISCSDGTSGSGTSLSGVTVSPNANTSCTITNTRKTGTLQVLKDLSPSNDPGLFDLAIDGTDRVTDVGDGGDTTAITVNTGTHTFGESAGTGTSLGDYSSTAACLVGATPVTATLSNGSWSVPVGYQQDVVCTITNTRLTGSLQVVKALVPTNDPGLFNLQIDGTTGKTDAGNGGSTPVTTLNTGSHTFGETAGTGTDASHYSASASCVDGRGAVTATAGAGGWSVNLSSGQAVVCTITNTHATGSLTVTKSISGGTPPAGGFVFDVSCTLGSWSLTTTLTFTAAGSQTVSGILTGATCNVSERTVSGWTASPPSAQATIGDGAASAVTMSFTNTRNTGSLQIAKHAVGHSTSQATFTFDVSCSDNSGPSASFSGVTVTTDPAGDGTSAVLGPVPSGSTCTVTEQGLSGWRNDSGSQSVVVTTGQVATVSFTNTQLYTDVSLTKGVDIDGDGPDDDGALVQPGDELVYTLTYSNAGNTTANGVVITDLLPANSSFVSIADGGSYDAVSGQAVWVVDIPAGGSGTVHWTVAAASATDPGTVIDNVASFVGPDNSGDSNPVVNPIAVGDLTLFKSVAPTGSARYGATLTYTLRATATGTLDQHAAVVTDVVPTGTTYVADSAACTDAPCPTSYDAATRTVSWTIGDLVAGASRSVTFKVTIDTPAEQADGSIPGTVIVNVGAVESTETPSTPSNEVRTPVTAVLGEKEVKPPNVLPFTGMPLREGLLWAAALVLLGAATTVTGRRRPSRKHRM